MEKNQNSIVHQQAKHYMRYLRRNEGESLDEIARAEGVSVKAIEKSIKQVELHRSLNNQGNLNANVVAMLMGNLSRVDKGFKKLFNAKSYVERRLADGSSELVPIDDTETQLETIKVFGKFIESMQPKGGGLAVNVNQTNQTASVTNIRHGGFVERMTEIRKRVQEHNLLPSVTVDAREADPDDEDDEDVVDAEEDEA